MPESPRKGANIFLIICLVIATVIFGLLGIFAGINKLANSANKRRARSSENYGVY